MSLRWVAAITLVTSMPHVTLGGEAPLTLVLQAEHRLTPLLERASDVRWGEGGTAVLTALGAGVGAFPLDPGATFEAWRPSGSRGGIGLWLPSRLGSSQDWLVVAPPIGYVDYQKRGSIETGKITFVGVEDLDVFDDRFAVLGTRRGEDGLFAPRGVIAWVAALGQPVVTPRPLLVSSHGPGAAPMDACAGFEIGALRFLPDGRLFVVPGVEHGAFLYAPDFSLERSWNTAALGLDAVCDFDRDTIELRSRDPIARWDWVNQHRVVDDVLPLSQGPGLLVRTVEASATRWELVILSAGPPLRLAVPVPSTSPYEHLRGDARGADILLLRFERGVEQGLHRSTLLRLKLRETEVFAESERRRP